MAKLTLMQASHIAGISRHALRRAEKSGRVRRNPDGTFDTEELERAGYPVQMALLPQERDRGRGPRRPAREVPRAPGKATPAPAELQTSVSVQLELAGYQVELTLRDTDETRVLARMEALLKQLPPATTVMDNSVDEQRPAPMRQRIMTLLQGYPAGLTRKEIQEQLHVEHNLKDTLYGMVRHKRLITPTKGVYVLRSDQSPTKAS
jgi:hypothetical protein